MIVLHYTDMATADAAVDWLCNPASKVSSHYLIAADGTLVRMVDETERAQHAGVGSWEGSIDINSRSIGIELDSPGHRPEAPVFPAVQIDALTDLLDELRARWPIPRRGVVAHSDVAPARKIDPGERFPWHVLADRGHALALPPLDAGVMNCSANVPTDLSFAGIPVPGPVNEGVARLPPGTAVGLRQADQEVLTDALRQCGYGVAPDADAAMLPVVVTAFHRRIMPWRVGAPADALTVAAALRFATLTEADRRNGSR